MQLIILSFKIWFTMSTIKMFTIKKKGPKPLLFYGACTDWPLDSSISRNRSRLSQATAAIVLLLLRKNSNCIIYPLGFCRSSRRDIYITTKNGFPTRIFYDKRIREDNSGQGWEMLCNKWGLKSTVHFTILIQKLSSLGALKLATLL